MIVFNNLEKEHIHEIIDITLGKLFKRIIDLGYDVQLTKKAKDFLSDKGYDPAYGARPLNRAIQKYLEDPVAEEILKGEINEGDTLQADWNGKDDALTIKIKKRKVEQKEKD